MQTRPCLDEEVILALALGELETSAGLDAALAHLDECRTCRLQVAAAAGAKAPERGSGPPVSERHPATIGRFVVDEVAGRGAMGIVYRGHDPRLGRPVALKLIRPELLGSHAHARLEREARALARVEHPAVVGVYEVGDFEGSVFIAMEYVDGPTLDAWLAAAPRSIDEILAAFRQAGEGLAAAHRAGLIHRDFKPSNAMVDARGVHVTDFGLVSESDASSSPGPSPSTDASTELALTQTGVVVGTPAYMAPEQLEAGPVDPRADQFSFCVALFEALAGHRPFEGANLHELLEVLRRGAPSPPRRPIPRRLHAALLRGLAPRPSDRFASMAELLDQLDPPTRRGRWLWSSVAICTLAIGAGLWSRQRADQPVPVGARTTSSVSAADVASAGAELPPSPGSACADVDARWAAVWTEERREALRALEKARWPAQPPPQVHPKLAARWEGIGRVNAALTLDGVARFGDAWRSRYLETCRDRFGSETAAHARLRRACLQDLLLRFEAVVSEPPEQTNFRDQLELHRAHLNRCSTHLVESLSLPEGEAADAAASAREQLARAAAASGRGQHARARALAEAAIADATRAADPPVLAEAQLELGRILVEGGQADPGLDALHEAIGFAQHSEHHRVFREAAELLAWTYLIDVDDRRHARLWLDTAARLDGDVPPTELELSRRAIMAARLQRLDGDLEGARAALLALVDGQQSSSVAILILDELLAIDLAEGAAEGSTAAAAATLDRFAARFVRDPSVLAAVAARRARFASQ